MRNTHMARTKPRAKDNPLLTGRYSWLFFAMIYVFTLATAPVAATLAATGTLVTGQSLTTSNPAGHVKPSVSELLTYIETADFPFTTFLQRLNLFGKAKDIHHRWPSISRYPREITVNGATLVGSAGAAKTITVDAVGLVGVGDILKAPNNATTAGAEFIVTAINSATSLDVYALPPSYTGTSYQEAQTLGTVPVFADNEALYWVSNAKSESDRNSAARSMEPQYVANYVQTFDATVEISDHAMRQENHGPQDWARMRKDSLYELRKSRESANIFNERMTAFVEPVKNKKVFTQKGLKGFSSALISLSASANEAAIVDFVYSAFDGLSGTKRLTLMGGEELLAPIDKVNAGAALNVMRNEKVAGVEITALQGRKGRIDIVYHPLFDEMGYADEGVIVDMNTVGRRDYQQMEKRDTDLAGVDAQGEYYICKETLEVRNPNGVKWVKLS